MAAAGWKMGNTLNLPARCSVPCRRVMPISVFRMNFVEKLPSVTMNSGSMVRVCSRRYGVQSSISSGRGSRFPGGRHFSTFAMNTSSRARPAMARSSFRYCPALPTKGSPCRSSFLPGASPTMSTRAEGFPTPNTVCVRPSASGHLRQASTCARMSSSGMCGLGMRIPLLPALCARAYTYTLGMRCANPMDSS